jgi:hypothetical protein
MEVRNMHSARHSIPHLLLAAASLFAFGCTPPDIERPPQRSPAPAEVASKPESLPVPQTPLDREGVILAALRAATAAALGEDDSAAQAQLKGRRFEVRIRFGCFGNDKLASNGWAYDAAEGVLRAKVRADVNSDMLKASDLTDGVYEGAVGFTLRRPWMLVDGCPDPRFISMADGPAIAITQLFTASDSRVERPEASYEAVAKVVAGELPTKGLNLILSGRLKPLGDGRAIRCAASEGPPACIISSVIDRVAIEEPVRNVTLAEFGNS